MTILKVHVDKFGCVLELETLGNIRQVQDRVREKLDEHRTINYTLYSDSDIISEEPAYMLVEVQKRSKKDDVLDAISYGLEFMKNKMKGEPKMRSDCGNEIKSVKFIVYLDDRGNGYIEVAAEKGTLPPQLMKSTEFANINDIPRIMQKKRKEVRAYESGAVFVCRRCTTAFGRNNARYRESCSVDQATATVACPNCGSESIYYNSRVDYPGARC